MSDLRRFFRDNPQALVLLAITLVLGLGTFLAVVIALAGAGHDPQSGELSGAVPIWHAALHALSA